MLIKKLKLVLIGVIVTYIIVYIIDYPTIYLFAFDLGLDTVCAKGAVAVFRNVDSDHRRPQMSTVGQRNSTGLSLSPFSISPFAGHIPHKD